LKRLGVILMVVPAPLVAQERTLDVLDGETLYEKGWLVTLGHEYERKDQEEHHATVAAAHYGLLHNVQLSLILPYVFRVREEDDPAGPDRLSAGGPGDLAALAKWRFYRWDAPFEALNLAALAGIEFPTGPYRERDGGRRLAPELQPGSGSWDPLGGLAVTYEPRRWRFNAFGLYQRRSENPDGYKFGDEVFAEIAAGNRFWLEPYPGPFMRGDVMVRFRSEARARQDGSAVRDTGGDLVTVGANLAFRPRPSLDFQLAVEVPVYERLNGEQAEEEILVTFTVGYRFGG